VVRARKAPPAPCADAGGGPFRAAKTVWMEAAGGLGLLYGSGLRLIESPAGCGCHDLDSTDTS